MSLQTILIENQVNKLIISIIREPRDAENQGALCL